MTELVTITPQAGRDANNDPLPAGTPFTLRALVAPGNTTRQYGEQGELDSADYTVYLPLKVKRPAGWTPTTALLTEQFTITVRGRVCVGRVKEWNEGGRGGIEILATSDVGATP